MSLSSIKGESTKLPKQETELNLKILFGRVWMDWWVILLSLIFCVGGALLFLRYKTPMYKISARVLVKDEKKGGGGVNAGELLGDLSSLLNMKSNVDNEAEIFKTRNLMEKVVRSKNLNILYAHVGSIKNLELDASPFEVVPIAIKDTITNNGIYLSIPNKGELELSYEDPVSEEQITKKIKFGDTLLIKGVGIIALIKRNEVVKQHENYLVRITSVDERVATLQKELKVSVTNKLVTIVDIDLNYSLPGKGEMILKELIEEYIRQNIEDKNMIADSTIEFIENRLRLVGNELGNIEGDIQGFKQANKLADLSGQSKLLVENTRTYITRIADIETQINIMKALEDYLRDEVKNKRVMPSSVLPVDAVFSKLVENYNAFLLERDRQILTSTEDNPYIKNLDERIVSLRNAMLSNLSGTRKSLEITNIELHKELDKLENEIRKVPAHERIYLDLARQQQIKQELYLFLLQKREETAISKTSNISNAKVIDYPKSEFQPHSPNKSSILFLGFFLGLVVPFVRLYFIDLLNDKIRTKEDVIKYASVPIVGEISHSDSEDTLIVFNKPKSVISEQFRALRTNLQFFIGKQTGNVILMTSSMAKEGKSFTALNLGSVLAISGKKVVLIELDLRKPNLSPHLNVLSRFGFTNFVISKDLKVSDVITPTGIHVHLSIITSGPLPPNPAELILNDRVDLMIRELKEEFDYIIIDAPPIGLVTDAQLLHKYADLTLYLVRQKHTFKSQLAIAEELYSNGKMKKMCFVINDINIANGYGYGGYGYGYGDYSQEKAKKKWWQLNLLKKDT